MSISATSNAHEREVAIFDAALQLPPERRQAYLEQSCTGDLELLARARALLRANESETAFLAPAVSAQSVEPRPAKRFGEYELLEEIARGGMGVVYKARQMTLNRVVAVKMILGGELAGPGFVQRFRAEAKAAASLQHPNIVAIHQVGEVDGQPYYSMDYVEGKNLAELVGAGPLQPRQAATYTRLIAEAVSYAHQCGIVHRDLKPSNILIDQFGQPRVTDFGLAKRLSGTSFEPVSLNLTLAGQVIGSPNYMSPEQAESRRGQTSPATDIYSLGAILYHLLVGRPPLVGNTLEETLAAVRSQEPIPPRVANPAIPADLETICMECLRKKPGERYESARALRDELERFLNDEPIITRPVTLTCFDGTLWADLGYSGRYRERADDIIPERRYLFHVLHSFVRHFRAPDRDSKICDLGCGDGSLGQQLLGLGDGVSLVLVDGSARMLDSAKLRLGERPNVRFVQATFDTLIRDGINLGRFDFIVSSLALHHLAQSERVAIFHRIFEALERGGWFLNLDTVLPDQPTFTDWHYELWREWLLEHEKHSRPAESLRHMPDEARQNPDNKLSPLLVQLKALHAIGFTDVECQYRNGIFALYAGRRP